MRHDDPKRFAADARLRLNDQDVRLIGRGTIDLDRGIVAGDYEIKRLPVDIDPLIFKTVLVTGYPSVCRSEPGANPFKVGSYRYRRTVDLGEHGSLSYSAICDAEAGRATLDSAFEVEGRLALAPLSAAQPIVETWVPRGRQILGRFTIAWPLRSGDGFVVGDAATEYEIPEGAANITRVRHRRIEFRKSAADAFRLSIVQASELL